MRLKKKLSGIFLFSWRDLFITAGILFCATGTCSLLRTANTSDGFASPIFVLAVLLVSRFTTGYTFGLAAALVGVVAVNYIYTYPYWEVNFTLSGYPLTFLSFLVVSLTTTTLTTKTKQQERLRAENERVTMRANLLRSVSHDIRTPLTSIIGASGALLDNPGMNRDNQRELLSDIRDEAQWLIRVVENLLSITRMEADYTRLQTELEAAEEILGGAVQQFRKRFPSIRVDVIAPEDLLLIPMDPILIRQVLSNLLENAVIHGITTTHIQLSVRIDGQYACFSVRDNGQGIPPAQLSVLFEGTLKSGSAPSIDGKRNMGLGLSVCMAIVRAHGGTMEARNLTPGAEVAFRLPLQQEDTP